jgi:hypothetical protein
MTPRIKVLQFTVLLALGLSASAQTSTLTFTIAPAVYYGSPTDTLALEHQTYSATMSDGLAGQLRSGYPETQFLWIDAATGRQFVEYANGTQVWGAPQKLPNGNLLYTMTFTGSPDQNSGQPNVPMQFSVRIETQPPVLIYVQRYRWRIPTLMWKVVGGSGALTPITSS